MKENALQVADPVPPSGRPSKEPTPPSAAPPAQRGPRTEETHALSAPSPAASQAVKLGRS